MFNRVIVYTTNDVKQSVLLEDTVKKLQEEAQFAYPLQVLHWTEEFNSDDFRALMIDDTLDPKCSYAVFESSVLERALGQLPKSKWTVC